MSRRFEEQVVLITGAGAGIGQAVALAFAREGARMVVNSRSAASTHTTAELLRAEGAEVIEVCGDVALPGTAQAMADAALQGFGRIDVLVNNAGIVIPARLIPLRRTSSIVRWPPMSGSVLQLTQAVLPAMRARSAGAIVNIASIAGLKGTKNRIAYSASKGALISMSRSMALELAPEHIRVNCVCPRHDTLAVAGRAHRSLARPRGSRGPASSPLCRWARWDSRSKSRRPFCSVPTAPAAL